MKKFRIPSITREDFRREVEIFNLKFRCTDCAHADREDLSCTFEYPNEELLTSDEFLDNSGEFIFCKYFELS